MAAMRRDGILEQPLREGILMAAHGLPEMGHTSTEAKWWDYTEWYNRRPIWVRVLFLPLLLAVMLIHTAVVLPYAFVLLACHLARHFWLTRRFWHRLRVRGQVTTWNEVITALDRQPGTLLVEFGPKGSELAWFIDQPRDALDSDHVILSWHEFEERGIFEAFDAETKEDRWERVGRWADERLGAYESSARALVPSVKQLREANQKTKRERILVVLGWLPGSLSTRLSKIAKPGADKSG